ncbi:hypothetical protein [Hyphomicrobium sp.]|uniref:hypothetical protein n=1 Tax=Hyphomicrobium sp. TaxID=82 RepID=UPI002D799C20|nr:hypothetical protein [Hyphomicrobium sp.]HET6388217.1 hypothetical protein [Hyphomicrobium sp.]
MKRDSRLRTEHGVRASKRASRSSEKKTPVSRTASAIRSNLVSHLALQFTDESWDDVLGLVAEKVRIDRGNRRIDNRALFRECEQLQAASHLLRKFCENRAESGWLWANCLAPCVAQVVNEKAANREEEDGSGNRSVGLPREENSNRHDRDRGLTLLLEMLDRFSKVSEFILEWRDPLGEHAGKVRELHRGHFAQSLAHQFVRAGGMFQAGGPAGFPQFLKLIWELLPPDCRTNTAESFADILSRLVSKSDSQRMPHLEITPYLFED